MRSISTLNAQHHLQRRASSFRPNLSLMFDHFMDLNSIPNSVAIQSMQFFRNCFHPPFLAVAMQNFTKFSWVRGYESVCNAPFVVQMLNFLTMSLIFGLVHRPRQNLLFSSTRSSFLHLLLLSLTTRRYFRFLKSWIIFFLDLIRSHLDSASTVLELACLSLVQCTNVSYMPKDNDHFILQ